MIAALVGRCHCGNVEVSFESTLPVDQLPLRACTCSFCSRHRARCTSDPNGRVRIIVRDESQLSRYRFGLKTADFLVCQRCGVYVGAILKAGGLSYATLNVNTFDCSENFTQEAVAVTYDGESETDRVARRRRNWTPVVVTTGGAY